MEGSHLTGIIGGSEGTARGPSSGRFAALAQEAAHLKQLAATFERWHQDMITAMAHNRDLNQKGEALAQNARELLMLSINAAIEAAHAGESARGFAVVASEVKSLAHGVKVLAVDIDTILRRCELTTATTFQDIQAGGKLIMAAISSLESSIEQLDQPQNRP
jgi:methyl-accepting chemotaxis protein